MQSGRSWDWSDGPLTHAKTSTGDVILSTAKNPVNPRQGKCVRWLGVAALLFATSRAAHAQALEGFQWADLRTNTDVIETVKKSLRGASYTALREIGYVGVPAAESPAVEDTKTSAAPRLPIPPDAHLLVITAQRETSAALPADDTYRVYDVDQKSATATELLSGPELKLAGWLRMRRDGDPEMVATYQDCVQCERTTFLTTFYLDAKTHDWHARWPRSKAGAPIYSEGQEANGGQQVYALLDDEAGRAMLGVWQHFSGRKRHDSDFVYEYLVDNYTGQEVTQPLAGADARALEQRLCKAQGEVLGIGGGQESAICKGGGLAGAGSSTEGSTARHNRR